MKHIKLPDVKPKDPRFSSGPVKKFSTWTLESLKQAALGRSHRSLTGKEKIKTILDLTVQLLELPKDYKLILIPGSDTGAIETAIWNLIGPLGVDIAAWENFGYDWIYDIKKELLLKDVRIFKADYGYLPDLSQISTKRDFIFTWNGTTSGVRVPNADFINQNHEGLIICDATSAVFAQFLDWQKLDAITFSWQKVLGGEAAHGMLILSPKALERLKQYSPSWPIPKIMRIKNENGIIPELFHGHTLNTPSLLCIEDLIQILNQVKEMGGLTAMTHRANTNQSLLDNWILKTGWVEHLCPYPEFRSNTGVCFKITDSELEPRLHKAYITHMTELLSQKNIAYDIANHRSAPASFRIWCGGTVEINDLNSLLPWLDWAYQQTMQDLKL